MASRRHSAGEESGGDDDEQQRDGVEGLVNALLPVVAPGDVGAVLEDGEGLPGLGADLGGQLLAEQGELPVVVVVVEVA
jgi:hypothetical protein